MDDVGWQVLYICLFTAVSLFFSLHNMTLRDFSRVKLAESFRGNNKAQRVEVFVEKVEDYTLICSFLRILSNLAIILLLLRLFDENAYLLTFIISAVIFTVFSVSIPHSWAKYSGEKILPVTCPLLISLRFLLKPILYIMRFQDYLIKRLSGVTEGSPDEVQDQKQEELMSLVEEGMMEGVVDEEEVEMIENVLELADTTAEEIMTPRTDLVALRSDEPLEKIIHTINDAGHSRIPVYEDNIDNIIGVLYAKDLLNEVGKPEEPFDLRNKIRKAYFVPETKPLTDLLHEFQNQKLHIAIVLDEYGGTAGIVTIEDILEELVGEITDEYEETPSESISMVDENTADVDARIYIDDLNEELDIDLPEEEDYDTLGGFVFSHLGYIPKAGESFEHDNIKFIIRVAEARRIKLIRIVKTPAERKEAS